MTVRLNPDSFYRNGVPLGASFYQNLDTAQANAINGDTGGTWTGEVILGGAGMWFAGPSFIGIGGKIQTPSSSGKRIVHAADDVPLLVSSHTLGLRTMRTSCSAAATVTNGNPVVFTAGGNYGALTMYPRNVVQPVVWAASTAHAVGAFLTKFPAGNGFVYRCIAAGTTGSSQPTWPLTIGATVTDNSCVWICFGPSGIITPARFVMPLRVHHGATFTQATLSVLTTAHTALPASWPAMRVYAVDTRGNVILLGGDPTKQGWVSFPPVILSAWNAQSVSLTYPINAGVIIDRRGYQYMCEVTDESGIDLNQLGSNGFPSNAFLGVASAFTTIGSLYFP